MIRVLQVIGSLNNGGSQAMIMNLYRNIDRSKIQFDFIIDRENELFFAQEIKALGGKIYILPTFNFKNILEYPKAWNKFFKEHPEYNIIHGHVRSTASIYLRIAKKYGLTAIAHSHSTSSGTGFSAIVKNILQYKIRYIADYFFACSKSAGIWLFGEKVFKEDNFYILKNAIDINSFIYDEKKRIEKRKELNIEGKFVIGHIGRFSSSKNHNFLIDVFKEIHQRESNAVLILVGDGKLRYSIENKVDDLGLGNNVIFTGVSSDIPELLQAMDVFVFPSLYEGLGIVAIEAQAAGLQCIVSDEVPQMATVTNMIKRISLKDGEKIWANHILHYKNRYNRKDNSKYILECGYDIKSTSQWLEKFYIDSL
ncbi:glycosyltransferase family 1 protein [Tepidibacter mesophilus]|uniref:glycosyltransferase family 1 protein n=1 Tax=Tepidibacter mesophilus TaxID=655607 RepID=UPI001A9A3439|nr:glycosyltransferase family 1 protein [Tepidibacter mesophilus]